MARKPLTDPYENNPSGDLLRGLDNNFFARLSETVRADREALRPFRQQLLNFTLQHVGNYYGEGGLSHEVPLPLISTFLRVHSRSLVPKEPRVNLVTFDEKMLPAVDAMEAWENDYFEEIDLGETLRRAAHDSLMSEAWLKVDLMPPEVAETGYGSTAGQPYVCTIDEQDKVVDMEARDYRSIDYWGYRYHVPKEVADDIFDREMNTLDPTDYDESGVPKMFTVAAGQRRRERIEDYVELWCIHLMRKGLVLTIASEDGMPGPTKKSVVRVRKYLGPKGGNLVSMGLGTVSGNLRPLSPVMTMMPLHLAANRSYRKLIDTADNYKSLLPLRGGSNSKDGKAIRDARHMEIINCDNPAEVSEKRFNLPPAELQLFVQDLRQAFDVIGGGIDAMSGGGPSAPTATQEKIIAGNAQAGTGDMAATVRAKIAQAVRVLNWYLWYHPENVYETVKKVPGQDKEFITRRLHPYNDELPSHQALVDAQALMREGPMPRIRVDPYSLTHMTPAERSQFVSAIMAEAAPYAAIMAQQGYFPDFGEWLKLKAKFGDEPAVAKLFSFKGAPQPQGGEGGEEGDAAGLNKEISVKPPETHRSYTRHSAGGGSQANRANDMRNSLMSMAGSGGE